MEQVKLLQSVVRAGVVLREVEESIYSALSADETSHPFDTKVGFYDLVVGNGLYNRMVWGNWPGDYRGFCRNGLDSSSEGVVLDVGCGSLVFTHQPYTEYRARPVVLFDRSLGMLRKAKQRLVKKLGKVPEGIVLLQGDGLNLPFREGAFESVFSFGMLHMFENVEGFLGELLRVKANSGQLFATCLLANNWFARKYLDALRKAGEVGIVCNTEELTGRLTAINKGFKVSDRGNMAYVALQGSDERNVRAA